VSGLRDTIPNGREAEAKKSQRGEHTADFMVDHHQEIAVQAGAALAHERGRRQPGRVRRGIREVQHQRLAGGAPPLDHRNRFVREPWQHVA
jgi:hypothetical protein